jgi:hypothetical protein
MRVLAALGTSDGNYWLKLAAGGKERARQRIREFNNRTLFIPSFSENSFSVWQIQRNT